MEAKSKQSNIRMPARKVRRVINTIRGKSVKDASTMLKFMPYFAAKVVEKNLKCAVANASEKLGAIEEELIVSEIYADDGPTYKRAKPRAQGRVYRIHKRNSHLTIIVRVSEELKEKLKEKKKKAGKPKAKKQETKPVETTAQAAADIPENEAKTEKQEVIEQEVVIETKEAEVLEEAKQELEQGITPDIETQPEIESPVESEAEKAETGKNIKVEAEQRESHTETSETAEETEKTEPETGSEATDNQEEENK